MEKCNVVLVGLSFGGSFVDIYKAHPNVGVVGIYDTNQALMEKFAKAYQITKTYSSFEEILEDTEVDAVHLVTPIPCHAEQTVRVLEAGKHCACTVPMATSLEDLQRIVDAKKKSGKNYMMMETTLYTYQFFYVKDIMERGELGKIQFLRGSHYQDMQNWPSYWQGLPPMHYGTHAIAPMVVLSNSRIKRVHCFGSGTMDESLHKQYGNPFPVECALFEFENGMKGEATRSLFETARVYQEGMFVYGSKKSFEWGFRDHSDPYVTTLSKQENKNVRGGAFSLEQVELPNYHTLLPEELHLFTVGKNYDPLNPQIVDTLTKADPEYAEALSKGKGGPHHGAHPHLVHEFVMSIVENRKPWIDEILGANITAAGICAHISAMKNGESVIVPTFE